MSPEKSQNNFDKVCYFINRVGFPIFVSIILMYFMFKTMHENTNALHNLTGAISKLTALLSGK